MLIDDAGNQLCWLIEGDLVFCSGYGKVTVISSNGGKIYTSKTENNSVHSSYLIDKTEAEQIVDDKLAELGNVSADNYRLIANITTEEDTSYILITQDAEGNSFDLKRVKMYIASGTVPTTTGVVIKASNVYNDSSTYILVNLSTVFGTSRRSSIYDIEATKAGTFTSAAQSTSVSAMSSTTKGYNSNVTSIDKLMIRGNSSTAIIPAGTQIKIWGY